MVRIPKRKHTHAINDLLELLGRRWALRILWELRGDALSFRRLGEACGGVSSSVLAQRLRELSDAAIVATDATGAYAMTPRGRELAEHVVALDGWARRYLLPAASSPSSRTARNAS